MSRVPVVNYANGERLVIGSAEYTNNGNSVDFQIMDTAEAIRVRDANGEDQSQPVEGEIVI